MWGDPKYDVAQICLNGHVVNSHAESAPEINKKFCVQCGEQTIMACPNCQSKILGSYTVPGFIDRRSYEKPSYCHNCGALYPWTERTIKAAEELADLIDNLDPEEKAELKATFPHLIKETPESQLAAVKFQRFLNKGKNEAVDALKSMATSFVYDGIKALLQLT